MPKEIMVGDLFWGRAGIITKRDYQFDTYGYVIGIVKDNQFFDLITKEKYPIIKKHDNGVLMLDDVKVNNLYIISIINIQNIFRSSQDCLEILRLSRKKATPKNIEIIRSMLERINLEHISSPDYIQKLNEKYPHLYKNFPGLFNKTLGVTTEAYNNGNVFSLMEYKKRYPR